MDDVWGGIAAELLHLYPRGTRLVAVAGADAERSRSTADALAEALRGAGHEVTRAHVDEVDADAVRTDVVAPFRQTAAPGGILIVSGPGTLLADDARGMWNFSLWQMAGDEPPYTVANALVEVTDPSRPLRRFADSC